MASSPAGEITLGIGLGFISVALGLLSLVVRSECEEISILWGCVHCKKKAKKREAAVVAASEV